MFEDDLLTQLAPFRFIRRRERRAWWGAACEWHRAAQKVTGLFVGAIVGPVVELKGRTGLRALGSGSL